MTNKKLSKIEKQIENEKQLENYPKLIKKIESQAVAEYKKELIDSNKWASMEDLVNKIDKIYRG